MTGVSEALPVRHIVWDWNGTLLDDNHAVLSAVNSVCSAFGREHVDLDGWRALFSRPISRSYERLLERSLSGTEWAQLDVLYHQSYRELLHTCQLADGAPELLETWSGQGRTQSLLSMWFHDELVPLVTEFGIDALFTRVDGLRESVGGGSKATHLQRHLELQKVDPRDAVLIGDVVDDAHAAEQAGTQCVLLTTGVARRSALQATGFPVTDSIKDALDYLDSRRN